MKGFGVFRSSPENHRLVLADISTIELSGTWHRIQLVQKHAGFTMRSKRSLSSRIVKDVQVDIIWVVLVGLLNEDCYDNEQTEMEENGCLEDHHDVDIH